MGAVAHDSPLQILIDENFLLIKTLYIFVTNIANKLNCRLEAFMKKIRDYELLSLILCMCIVSCRIMKKVTYLQFDKRKFIVQCLKCDN